MEQTSKRGPELHPPYYNFLGPRTEFYARMIGSDFYKQTMLNAGRMLRGTEPYNEPIDDLDRCAMEHDAIFARNNNTEKDIRDADIKFRECASKIKDPKLLYYATIQASQSIIKTKEFSEDIGIISPDLFANINRSIDDLNMTLAKNHTIPSTKEEQQQVDRNFWILALMLGFRVATDLIVIPVGTRLTTEGLIKLSKKININLMTRVPVGLRPMIEFLVNRLMGRQTASQITKQLVDFGLPAIQSFLGSLFEYDFFGTGVPGQFAKYGLYKIAQIIIDNLLTRISTQFGSNSWRERNIMTAEEIDEIIEGRGADIYRAETQRYQEIGRFIGLDLNNARIIALTNIFRNIENLSNREKIAKFGNFYRDIIKVRNEREDGILTVVYILLTGSYRTQFVAEITVEKLREILNKKISFYDIRILLNNEILIDKLKRLFDINILDDQFLMQYSYIDFIDMILKRLTITQKGLKDLLLS